ncbi:MAG: hypothetical protein ACMUIP_07460 [bacterium]
MIQKKQMWKLIVMGIAVVVCIGLINSPLAHSQYWTNLPPYNTLWPLWSPVLSPANPLTGLPTPLVSSLTRDTVLPIQPGLTWDPRKDNPYLLYNTLLGMAYFDPLYGVNLWPPSDLLDPLLGTPLPIDLTLLPGGGGAAAAWSLLAPTSTTWLTTYVPIGNNAFYNSYDAFAVAYEILQGGTLGSYPLFATLLNPPPAYVSLLTPGLILGF